MATLTISDQVYQRLQALAQERGQTPEALLEALLNEQEQPVGDCTINCVNGRIRECERLNGGRHAHSTRTD